MLQFCNLLDAGIKRAAAIVGFLILVIAGAQLLVVILRYVFYWGSILLQELALNLNVAFVAIGICYGVLRNVHTRVDALKERQSDTVTNRIELLGAILFILPTAAFLTWALIPYVAQSLVSLEGSRNISGMPGVYIVKSTMLVMSIVLTLQAIAIIVRLLVGGGWPYPHAADGPVDG